MAKASNLKYDSSLSRIESGTRKVSLEELYEISKVLGNFRIVDVLLEAGYISEQDINPKSKVIGLELLNDQDLKSVQDFVDFLISRNPK